MSGYFDNLALDYRIEVPDPGQPETARRLLYLFKNAANGVPCILMIKEIGAEPEYISASPEWLNEFGYTLEDLNNDINGIHPDDLDVALIHGQNNLAGPYQIRMQPKQDPKYWVCEVQALSVSIDNHVFRGLIIRKIQRINA